MSVIRRITAADRAAYIEMAREFYQSPAVLAPVPDAYFGRTFDELMRSSGYAQAYIFEIDGETAGYALLAKTYSQEAGGLAVWVEELYLRPEHRGRGVGSEFLEFVRKDVPAARYRLETEPENESAARLYERHGYSPLGYVSYVLDEE